MGEVSGDILTANDKFVEESKHSVVASEISFTEVKAEIATTTLTEQEGTPGEMVSNDTDGDDGQIESKVEEQAAEQTKEQIKDQAEGQIGEHTEGMIKNKVEEQAENMTESQVNEQVEDQVEEQKDQAEEQTEDMVKIEVENEVEIKVESQTGNLTEGQFESKVDEQVEDQAELQSKEQTEDMIENKVEDKVEDKVENQTGILIEGQFESKVDEQVEDQAELQSKEQTEDMIENKVKDKVDEQAEKLIEGQVENKVGEQIEEQFKDQAADKDNIKDDDQIEKASNISETGVDESFDQAGTESEVGDSTTEGMKEGGLEEDHVNSTEIETMIEVKLEEANLTSAPDKSTTNGVEFERLGEDSFGSAEGATIMEADREIDEGVFAMNEADSVDIASWREMNKTGEFASCLHDEVASAGLLHEKVAQISAAVSQVSLAASLLAQSGQESVIDSSTEVDTNDVLHHLNGEDGGKDSPIYNLMDLFSPIWEYLKLGDSGADHGLRTCVVVCVAMVLACFVSAELTRNLSQSGKFWGLMPVVYAWTIEVCAIPMNARTLLMAFLVSIWGGRMCLHLMRTGAYSSKSGENLRWRRVRELMQSEHYPFFFAIFDLVCVAGYGQLLLMAQALPVYVAAKEGVDVPLNRWDFVLSCWMVGLTVVEMIADEQHQKFQEVKSEYEDLSESCKPPALREGFLSSQLFSFCRHPNYAAEQAIWTVFYLFSVNVRVQNGEMLPDALVHWSACGVLMLGVLFSFSSTFSENLSALNYDNYKEYQRVTCKYLPFGTWGTWEGKTDFPSAISEE
ncbi:Dynein heavy chain-like protein PF11_0240 [Hondaea fermentalgiana]|uniref:Dynein heavy chain-like protein PF11_0240 n=1 Tax=Hondaea fermentalgiana TaxID=2315210 RepID=A0A2R5GKA6_9STRA|nr:Dynein heavy chain-like protein PF11_0240 [Hondaea fermentalgiana]|eukprot:GBG29063.1 Dynein heavy chain-like protein PF11_0240 [Hondaea fermentalgiana]